MKETLSVKYLAILALIAVVVLLIGASLRPHKNAPLPPSPSETARLEQRVRREQAAGIGQYLASRAAELADQAVFLTARGTSAVRYESPTKVVTGARPEDFMEPMLMVMETSEVRAPAPIATAQWNPDGWMLLIGRASNNQALWTAGIQGASRPASCGDVAYKELILNVPLDPSFTGAGAFDLDGGLLGVVMRCEDALHIVSITSVPDMLAASSGPAREFIAKFGFRTTPLPESWQDRFPRLKGFLVTDVWIGTWADRNGIAPGDLVVSEAERFDMAGIGSEMKIVRSANPTVARIRVEFPEAKAGMILRSASSTLPELVVTSGTPAYLAGLRTGDRLVSILGERATSLPVLAKLLTGPNATPVRIVYERGHKRSVVEVPHE